MFTGSAQDKRTNRKALRLHQKYTYLERVCNRFGTVTLVYKGGGGGRGTASVSVGAGWSSTDPGAPSVLCGGSCAAPVATCSTTTIEPTGLMARFPSARSSGVLASDAG